MKRKKISSKIFLEVFSICLLIFMLVLFLVSKARVSLVDKDLPLKSETVLKYCLQIEDFRYSVITCVFFISLIIIFKILSFFFKNTFLSVFIILTFILTIFLTFSACDSAMIEYKDSSQPQYDSIGYIHDTFNMIDTIAILLIVIQGCIVVVDSINTYKSKQEEDSESSESQKKIKSEE